MRWSRRWRGRTARSCMIDQRRLPAEEVYLRCRDHREVAAAIRDMAIRGAPAIGVAAALGIALGVRNSPAEGEALRGEFDAHLRRRWRPRGPPRSTSSGPSSACAAASTPTRPRAGPALRDGAARGGAGHPGRGRGGLPRAWATWAPS